MFGRVIVSFLIFASLLLILGVHQTEAGINASSSTAIFVTPTKSYGVVGRNFSINIDISSVVDLYGWEFRLGWNTALLVVININEGPFLKSGGKTFFAYKTNSTTGYIIVDCTLLSNIPGVSGDGTLATIEFNAIAYGQGPLSLNDTVLIDSHEQAITHITLSGYYYASIFYSRHGGGPGHAALLQ
jgi:general secretion pathway protein D